MINLDHLAAKIGKAFDPVTSQLFTLLRGINDEQRRTNELLELLRSDQATDSLYLRAAVSPKAGR